jgi:hypothetical protein
MCLSRRFIVTLTHTPTRAHMCTSAHACACARTQIPTRHEGGNGETSKRGALQMMYNPAVVLQHRVVEQHKGQVIEQVADKDARKEVGRPGVAVHKIPAGVVEGVLQAQERTFPPAQIVSLSVSLTRKDVVWQDRSCRGRRCGQTGHAINIHPALRSL